MATRKPEAGAGNGDNVAVVKKYANRRLYNTATSCYVTLEELCHMVRNGEEFVVYDAKSGEDITRSVLTQIILDEDSKGRNLLPIGFLRQVIGYYDDNLHAFLPRYLELSMENFARHQDQMRSYMEDTFGRFFPVSQFEDMARQNMAMFQRAASMFQPFPGSESGGGQEAPSRPAREAAPSASAPPAGPSQDLGNEMRELKTRMHELQRQLEQLDKAASRTPVAEKGK
ncbi:polyhydroxyalkanoate synthesis repressor PhaR [Marinimicrococcus flavescens]|uniref:Polyhydroxyalkanoate synthesis repressor PhaR n=1 Tax=Marinimicrococcus flavescens TaxID=3031815 RepID=A0AAP3XPR5_9PROT|nr:polyhydroxyalkanoate synthesis repressor PhaR [Marinimicrococcus flavescens]